MKEMIKAIDSDRSLVWGQIADGKSFRLVGITAMCVAAGACEKCALTAIGKRCGQAGSPYEKYFISQSEYQEVMRHKNDCEKKIAAQKKVREAANEMIAALDEAKKKIKG